MKRILSCMLALVLVVNIPSTVMAESCEFINSDFRIGDTGKKVEELQRFLVKNKYLKTISYGYFGSKTSSAFKKYKNKNSETCKSEKSSSSKDLTNSKESIMVTNSTSTYPFKLELSSDRYKVNPGEQIMFNVKLINISNATVTGYKLGKVSCTNENELGLNPIMFYDNKIDFWPVGQFLNSDPCANKFFNNFIKDVPPGKSYEVKIPQRNFSRSTTQQMYSYGYVTSGEHTAVAKYEVISPEGKSVMLVSNLLKFYTELDKVSDFPKVKIEISLSKKKIKKGEVIKMQASVKNIGNQDFEIANDKEGNIFEQRNFWIDGRYLNLDFFNVDMNRPVYSDLEQETLFKNQSKVFRVGDVRTYSINGQVPDNFSKNNTQYIKKVSGDHTVQFKVVYKDNFGNSKEYVSNTEQFEVVLE